VAPPRLAKEGPFGIRQRRGPVADVRLGGHGHVDAEHPPGALDTEPVADVGADVAAVGGRVGQQRHQWEQVEEAAGPAVGEQQRLNAGLVP
jgi:hypothetical protein